MFVFKWFELWESTLIYLYVYHQWNSIKWLGLKLRQISVCIFHEGKNEVILIEFSHVPIHISIHLKVLCRQAVRNGRSYFGRVQWSSLTTLEWNRWHLYKHMTCLVCLWPWALGSHAWVSPCNSLKWMETGCLYRLFILRFVLSS